MISVNCPKCKSEIPDTTKFCPECGEPQTVVAESLVRTKTPSWAIVLAFLCFGLVAYIAVHLVNDSKKDDAAAIKPRAAVVAPVSEAAQPNVEEAPAPAPPQLPPAPPPPEPHSIPIGNGAVVVAAHSVSWYPLFVPPGATTVSVTGRFTATGGVGNDIFVYVLDQDGLTNFNNGHQAPAYYNSGKLTTASIGAVLPTRPATYYLVFDNRFSALTPKAVQFNAALNYLQ
jgi:hypothetical protein